MNSDFCASVKFIHTTGFMLQAAGYSNLFTKLECRLYLGHEDQSC